MRIKSEVYEPGVIIHYYNRCSSGKILFFDYEDNDYLKNLMYKTAGELQSNILAYCYMPNHFHVLMRQEGDIPMYKVFQRIMTSYTQVYNRKHENYGRLFSTKLNGKIIKDDAHFTEVIPYIHLNPVKAGIVDKPEDWQFSDYNDWTHNNDRNTFRDELIKEIFQSKEKYRYLMYNHLVDIKKTGRP